MISEDSKNPRKPAWFLSNTRVLEIQIRNLAPLFKHATKKLLAWKKSLSAIPRVFWSYKLEIRSEDALISPLFSTPSMTTIETGQQPFHQRSSFVGKRFKRVINSSESGFQEPGQCYNYETRKRYLVQSSKQPHILVKTTDTRGTISGTDEHTCRKACKPYGKILCYLGLW